MSWPAARLADLVDAKSGFACGEDVRGGVFQFRMNNVTMEGALDLSKRRRVPSNSRKLDSFLLQPNDVLFNATNSPELVGKTAFFPGLKEPATYSNHFLRLRPIASIDGRYLARWLTWQYQRKTFVGLCRQWVNQASVSREALLNLTVPLPPLPEQRRIAAILDQADELRAKRRESLARIDSLAHAVFLDLFGSPATNPKGWPWKRLGQLAIKFSDGPFGSNLKSSHYTEDGIRVIRLQNIGVGTFLDTDKAFISERHFETLRKHECLPGDVLVGTMGDPNLRACVQPEWLPIALNKADCVQIRPDATVCNSDYLCALLNEPETESMAQQLILGQTRLRISMGRLRELNVPVPPISIQTVFSERLRALRDLGHQADRCVAHLDDLFASLQHRAFRGEL